MSFLFKRIFISVFTKIETSILSPMFRFQILFLYDSTDIKKAIGIPIAFSFILLFRRGGSRTALTPPTYYIPNSGLRLIHCPRVKSGKSTNAPPRAIDISDKAEIALQAAAS